MLTALIEALLAKAEKPLKSVTHGNAPVTHTLRIWWISLLIKLGIGAFLPLGPDEAYYWVWSNHLQASYYDHPPMIAWLLYLGHPLEGLGHAVRWPVIILGHITLFIWIEIFRQYKILDPQIHQRWLWLALFSPLIGFGTLIATPDVPVVFFWSLGLLLFIKTLEQNKFYNYLFFGVSLGLGFCSKYHIVLLPLTLLVYLFTSQNYKRVRWSMVPLTILAGLLFSLPVVLWNIHNDFISFRFQFQHGLGKSYWNWEWTRDYVVGQLALLLPVLIFLIFKSWRNSKMSLIKMTVLFPYLFFLMSSFRGHVEGNWPIFANLSVIALVSTLDSEKIKKYVWAHIIFWGSLISLVIAQLFVSLPLNLPEKLKEPHMYAELAKETAEFYPLYGDTYQTSSSLSYYGKKEVNKLYDMSRTDFYDFLLKGPPKEREFFLIRNKETSLPDWISQQHYSLSPVRTIGAAFEVLKVTAP